VYIPELRGEALGIEGDVAVEVNPPGPAQLYPTPLTLAAERNNEVPEQTGLLLPNAKDCILDPTETLTV
jgi:hypothetical protein